MANQYPTTKRPCRGKGCALRAVSSDPHICAERLINIPYRCADGHAFVVKLPALTDYERRPAHQAANRAALAAAAAAERDPALVARELEELRREQARIEAENAARIEAENAEIMAEIAAEEDAERARLEAEVIANAEAIAAVPERKFFK